MQDARGDKSVAAVVAAAAHEERVADAEPCHRLGDGARKRRARPLHKHGRGRTRTDRRLVEPAHLPVGKRIFHKMLLIAHGGAPTRAAVVSVLFRKERLQRVLRGLIVKPFGNEMRVRLLHRLSVRRLAAHIFFKSRLRRAVLLE